MKKNILIPAIIFVFTQISCTKQPEACFTANQKTVDLHDDLILTNCSQNAYFYEWEFGNNKTQSTAENPTIEVNYDNGYEAGYFNVKLKAYSSNKKKYDEYTYSFPYQESDKNTVDWSKWDYLMNYNFTKTVTYYNENDTTTIETSENMYVTYFANISGLKIENVEKPFFYINAYYKEGSNKEFTFSRTEIFEGNEYNLQGEGYGTTNDGLFYTYTITSKNNKLVLTGKTSGNLTLLGFTQNKN